MSTFEDNLRTGIIFENYVKDLFPPQIFQINNRNTNLSLPTHKKQPSDNNPDITIRDLKTLDLFNVECKYRSKIYNKIHWAKLKHINNYIKFDQMYKNPTFIVIGLEGSASSPERMFCLPLKNAEYTNLYISFLKSYERSPKEPFSWINGTLI